EQHRGVAESPEDGQRERRIVRKLKDEPGAGHRLHPGPDDGYCLPHEVAAEFGVLEGGNLHHGATAWFDSRRSGSDTTQFIGVALTAGLNRRYSLDEFLELRRGGYLWLLDHDRKPPFARRRELITLVQDHRRHFHLQRRVHFGGVQLQPAVRFLDHQPILLSENPGLFEPFEKLP